MTIENTEMSGDQAVLRFDVTQSSFVDAIVDDDDARYELEMRPDEPEMEDGVVLTANRSACLALAKIFGQLALCDLPDGHSVRLGWDEADAVGIRIVLDETGRMDGIDDEDG